MSHGFLILELNGKQLHLRILNHLREEFATSRHDLISFDVVQNLVEVYNTIFVRYS